MAAAVRAVLLALALCAFQTSQASLLPSFDDMLTAAKSLEETTEATLESIMDGIKNSISAVQSSITSGVSASLTAAQSKVDALISQAEADGISVAECNLAAAANTTRINVDLPISLAHCSVDYLDAFDYYILLVNNDFALIFQEIANATQQDQECSLIDIPCHWDVFYSASKFVLAKQRDIALQVVDAQTAGVNLVATITKCNEEKSTQAALDVALVVPQTVRCIQQKREEATASS